MALPCSTPSYSTVLREIRAAAARGRPICRTCFDRWAHTSSINDDHLRDHLVYEMSSTPECVAQLPQVSLSGAKACAPQKIIKDSTKDHQLACHFVNQSPLLEAHLRVRA